MGGEERAGVWRYTGGEEEHRLVEEADEAMWREMEQRVGTCVLCGGQGKVEMYGMGRRGVWVGCDRDEWCVMGIEQHDRGWSVDEAIEEWNRKNRGANGVIRRIKMRMRKRRREKMGEREK